jgi:hypothetical protein
MSGYGLSSAKGAYVNTTRPKVYSIEQRKARKAKKMKLTFKQRFRNWLNSDDGSDKPEVVQDIGSSELGGEGMRFQLYRAAGGYVVETRYYDHKQDRHFHKLHIINDDQDVGHAIGKIITLESLR